MCTPNGTTPAANCACTSGALNGGGGVVDQHSPQAEVDEVVPPVVPGRTIGLHARLEGSIRVLPVFDEVRHRVYQTAGTPPEG